MRMAIILCVLGSNYDKVLANANRRRKKGTVEQSLVFIDD
jgi:hypothetical protein